MVNIPHAAALRKLTYTSTDHYGNLISSTSDQASPAGVLFVSQSGIPPTRASVRGNLGPAGGCSGHHFKSNLSPALWRTAFLLLHFLYPSRNAKTVLYAGSARNLTVGYVCSHSPFSYRLDGLRRPNRLRHARRTRN
jgi:hypothetical protein